MTSRKNQQAARQYMREHDVPYMEALRRVTHQAVPARIVQAHNIPGRPLDEPLILGYTAPRHEDPKPSLLGRFRKKTQEEPVPTPYTVSDGVGNTPRLVTVYGPPGTGKTMLLRSILKQFRGYAAYIVHDGYLLGGPSLPNGQTGEGIEPWDGLTEVSLQPWLAGLASSEDLDVPTPPSIMDLPRGALVVFDIGGVRNLVEDEALLSASDRKVMEAMRPWLEFEKSLGHLARSKAISVATSVMTDSGPRGDLPLSLLASPLEGPGTRVRLARDRNGFPRPRPRPGDPWVYEATSLESDRGADHFTLTKEEAAHLTRPHVSDDEAGRGVA